MDQVACPLKLKNFGIFKKTEDYFSAFYIMKNPCLSGYKKRTVYNLRIARGSGGLPPDAEQILNFHVGRRLILSTLYHEKSMSFIKRTVYGLAP